MSKLFGVLPPGEHKVFDIPGVLFDGRNMIAFSGELWETMNVQGFIILIEKKPPEPKRHPGVGHGMVDTEEL